MKEFFKKHVFSLACFLLAVVLILLAIFYPEEKKEEEKAQKKVVRVWNVDTFEGGKGSRTSFLKSAARRVEKKLDGVYYLVSSFTPEGARQAFCEGNFPDVLSFGIGLDVFLEKSVALPYSFAGGEVGKDCFAYPWCRGGYALFSLKDDFEREGKTVISSGGNNLALLSAAMSEIEGEELPSLTAYTKFLNGEYEYLLGTQRDLCRFRSRGVEVYSRPLKAYSDLYQYFSVLNPAVLPEGRALLESILSEPERLEEIGMFPAFSETEFAPLPEKTPLVFSSREALAEIRSQLMRGEENFHEKFLKTI